MTERGSSCHHGTAPQEWQDTAPTSATLPALYTAHGAFPVHVVRKNGLPDVALTVFANDLHRILSDSSVWLHPRDVGVCELGRASPGPTVPSTSRAEGGGLVEHGPLGPRPIVQGGGP